MKRSTGLVIVLLSLAVLAYDAAGGRLSVLRRLYTRDDLGAWLIVAAGNDDHESVRCLLQRGADVNARNESGDLPLHCASRDNFLLLLDRGADLHEKDAEGRGLLHCAALCGWRDIAQLLITKGADVNSRNKCGRTPLHDTSYTGPPGHTDVAALLVASGAEIDPRDDEGRTPLHEATDEGCKGVAQLLVRNGADINAQDKSGKTPLDLARTTSSFSSLSREGALIRFLRQHGAKTRHELDREAAK